MNQEDIDKMRGNIVDPARPFQTEGQRERNKKARERRKREREETTRIHPIHGQRIKPTNK